MLKNISKFMLPCVALIGISSAYAIPNPASVNCANLKGVSETLETHEGQLGLCNFGKASIEEWTLFRRGASNKIPKAIRLYSANRLTDPEASCHSMGIPNSAALQCRRLGGQTHVLHDSARKAVKTICKFGDGSGEVGSDTDGSAIEQWTLYYGYKSERNSELTNALGINI